MMLEIKVDTAGLEEWEKSDRLHNDSAKTQIQWNLRTRDTLGLIVLSLVERPSLSQRVPYRRFHCIQCIIPSSKSGCIKRTRKE